VPLNFALINVDVEQLVEVLQEVPQVALEWQGVPGHCWCLRRNPVELKFWNGVLFAS
jgi:hypothetical protein